MITLGLQLGLVAPATVGAPHLPLHAPRANLPTLQFDEEGGMVKGVEENALSFDERVAAMQAPDDSLPADKAARLVLKEPEWNVEKMAVSATDADFELSCNSMGDTEVIIEVPPSMNTFEDYFYGFTADSDSQFTIAASESSPIEGRMQRRGGEPEVIKVKCDPGGKSGTFTAHLCFILDNEPMYSKYYSITCTAN